MFQQLYVWIQNITVFLIVTAAVLQAVPGNDYGKYIRFFSGLVLILLLASPLLNLTGMREKLKTLYRNREYEIQEMEIEKVEEIFSKSGISEILKSQENSYGDERKIEVGEIEIGP